jgi:histone H2B
MSVDSTHRERETRSLRATDGTLPFGTVRLFVDLFVLIAHAGSLTRRILPLARMVLINSRSFCNGPVIRAKGDYKARYDRRVHASNPMQHDEEAGANTEPTKPRRKKGVRVYDAYIHRTMRKVQPGFGLTQNGVAVMNKFIDRVEWDLSCMASELARHNGTKTLQAREIETAVALLFPEELAVHATAEGAKAVKRFRGK